MDAARRTLIPSCLFGLTLMTSHAQGALPKLIPRDVMFTTPAKTAPKLSPDGAKLSYLASSGDGVMNVWIRTIGADDDRQATHDEKRGIFAYAWAADSRHLLYVQDRDGDENWHLYTTDLASGETRDLTPFAGVRAGNVLTDAAHPRHVMVSLNKRDPRVSDMYRVDLESGEITLEAENPGDVVEWVTDPEFKIRAVAAIDSNASAVIRVRDRADGPWRDLQAWPFEEAGFDRFQRIVGFSGDGTKLILQSARGTNTTRLVEVDLASGKERDVAPADPKCDLWNLMDFSLAYMPAAVLLHPETKAVQAYAVYHMKPEWRVLDPSLAADFARLAELQDGSFAIVDRSYDDRTWLVHDESDVESPAHYVYDRDRKSLDLLFVDVPALADYTFAPMEVVSYRARDGLELWAYLTVPVGVERKNLPLIVMPHGGPWFRDNWGFNGGVQWLANRGYAVLQPQFRGSIGFGNAFVTASNGEMGGKMQQDITDAVKWAIVQGIADPERVGIFGGSYGGYATLAGITFTPELYACAVDLFGVSNMKTSFEAFPPYWGPRIKRWVNRVGNVLEDDALNRRISPVFHVDRIRAPLLIGHGANDVRVRIEESDRIVEAMRKNGRDVTYVVYPDEGHGFGRPANASDFNGRVEEFLAAHLGGRKEPWRKVEGTSAEVR